MVAQAYPVGALLLFALRPFSAGLMLFFAGDTLWTSAALAFGFAAFVAQRRLRSGPSAC